MTDVIELHAALKASNEIIKNLTEGDPEIVKRALYFWAASLQNKCNAANVKLEELYPLELAKICELNRNIWELEVLSSYGGDCNSFAEQLKDKPAEEIVQAMRLFWSDGFNNGTGTVLSGIFIDAISEAFKKVEKPDAKQP